MAAERTVVEVELVPDVLVDGLRNADGAGLGERLEPGGDVDAIAEDVVTVDDHVAEVDTDPQFETALGRDRIVDRMRGPLHLDSAAQRIDHARKIRQKAVARGADDPPAMPCDQRVDGAAQGAQGLMRACLILPHQAAEADDIRVQDRGEFPLPRAGFEDFSHPPSNDEPKIQG
jgi:hypothetical protein